MESTTVPSRGDHTLITVSPHPDDETLGIGASLSMLIESGWVMRNLACSLGHAEDHERRRAELAEAGARLGFTTTEMQPPARLSRHDDLRAAAEHVAGAVTAMIERHSPVVVVSPHLGDGHHAHEAVAQGVRLALEGSPDGPVWWQYGIWNDLPRPTTYIPYGEDAMARVARAIDAYGGENARSHYDLMHPARAVVARTLGSERVFGYGTASASDLPYADLVTEVRHTTAGWQVASPRTFSTAEPLATSWEPRDVSWWVESPSLREQWSRPPGRDATAQ
jgi:LmbE family N-acetylglucosaminyl deacetylase